MQAKQINKQCTLITNKKKETKKLIIIKSINVYFYNFDPHYIAENLFFDPNFCSHFVCQFQLVIYLFVNKRALVKM